MPVSSEGMHDAGVGEFGFILRFSLVRKSDIYIFYVDVYDLGT